MCEWKCGIRNVYSLFAKFVVITVELLHAVDMLPVFVLYRNYPWNNPQTFHISSFSYFVYPYFAISIFSNFSVLQLPFFSVVHFRSRIFAFPQQRNLNKTG